MIDPASSCSGTSGSRFATVLVWKEPNASAQIPDDPRRGRVWRRAGGIGAIPAAGLPPRHDLAGFAGPRREPEWEGPGRRVGAAWVHPRPESDGGSTRRHGRGVEAAAIVCGI